MSDQPILIISGTNRDQSNSIKIAKTYAALLDEQQLKNKIINLADMPDDFIKSALYDQSGKNALFNATRESMIVAKKMVFVVPEYNGSFPGVLKTFIDGLAFPKTFTGKKIALVGLSSGIQGGVLAMSHLTDIFNYCGAHVLANKPKLFGIDSKIQGNSLEDPSYLSLLKAQVIAFKAF